MRLLLLIVAFFALASSAAAQPGQPPRDEPSEQEVQQARRFYQQGVEAARAERWAEALRSFERSYELSGTGVALFSIGITLESLGRITEARQAFHRALDHGLELELRQRAEQVLATIETRIAVLSLIGLPLEPPPRITFDGNAVDDDGNRPLRIEADPGDHRLEVSAGESDSFQWQGRLDAGEQLDLDVAFDDDGGNGGLLRQPLFWVGVGAVVVAAGVTAGLLIHNRRNQLEPRRGMHLAL